MPQNTSLLSDVLACSLCEDKLPLAPRPVLQLSYQARILVAGQAPGRKAHDKGIPFADASGDRLRQWMGLDESQFYDASRIAIMPMGFCFPGTGNSGDLPPRPECAETWHASLLVALHHVELTLVIGRYAMAYHLPDFNDSVTDAVKNWQAYWPDYLPLPHPSPRNQRWLKQNPWFEREVLPLLKQRVANILD
ncbi:MAG: uracil-DNA glycosylase family protein [Pseudomonadota bacterium]|nr:uracil-DNA glycosylase family protein [Pseudomonadota bacterium]